MKKSITILTLIVLIVIFLFSCDDPEQEISWDTQDIPPKLVVEGSVTTDYGNHPITLKRTDNYFANKPAGLVSNAMVEVVFGEQSVLYSEDRQSPGTYIANESFSGEIGQNYRLNIELEEEIDEAISYTGESEINNGIEIDSIYAEQFYNPSNLDDEDSLIVLLMIYGQEPPNTKNYYLLKLYRNGEAVSDTITDHILSSDQETGAEGEYGIGFFIFDEYDPGDTLGIELFSVTKGYYEFLRGVNEISEPGDPFGFSGPPANAVSNINGGQGLGYFFAASVSKAETVVVSNY